MYSIYKITNKIDGKIYVGKTTKSIEYRFRQHIRKSHINVKYGGISYLHRAMSKYGCENFSVSLLEECQNEDELNIREKFWIKELHSQDPEIGYNIQDGGNGGGVRSKEFTLTQKQLDALERGRHLPSSTTHKQQLANRRKGCIVSDETRELLRQRQLGKKASVATRQKMSATRLGKKLPNRSAESREKYRDVSLDRVHIHKGEINKNPKRCDLDKYLSEGYELGYFYQK